LAFVASAGEVIGEGLGPLVNIAYLCLAELPISFGCCVFPCLWRRQPGSFEETVYSEEAVEEVNAVLPEDIRLYSVTKVGKGFRPRDACSFREYEYVLPVRMLEPLGPNASSHPHDEARAIEAFFRVLKKFEGTHNFHNFTKLRGREITRKLSGQGPQKDRRAKWDQPADGKGSKEEEDEEAMAMGNGQQAGEEEAQGMDVEEGELGENRPPLNVVGTAVVDEVRRFNTETGINPLFTLIKNKSPDAESGIVVPVSLYLLPIAYQCLAGIFEADLFVGIFLLVVYCYHRHCHHHLAW